MMNNLQLQMCKIVLDDEQPDTCLVILEVIGALGVNIPLIEILVRDMWRSTVRVFLSSDGIVRTNHSAEDIGEMVTKVPVPVKALQP